MTSQYLEGAVTRSQAWLDLKTGALASDVEIESSEGRPRSDSTELSRIYWLVPWNQLTFPPSALVPPSQPC